MTKDEAIARLNEMNEGNSDIEEVHAEADNILAQFVPEDLREAYISARHRVGFWYA